MSNELLGAAAERLTGLQEPLIYNDPDIWGGERICPKLMFPFDNLTLCKHHYQFNPGEQAHGYFYIYIPKHFLNHACIKT